MLTALNHRYRCMRTADAQSLHVLAPLVSWQIEAPPTSHTVVRSSDPKSRLLPSLNATVTETVADVGKPIGVRLAGFSAAVIAVGDTVKLDTAVGVGILTLTVPSPPPIGTPQTDQAADRNGPHAVASPTCSHGATHQRTRYERSSRNCFMATQAQVALLYCW